MKKLIKLSTICILTSILFSSCRSNMSLTKRHYNNGYYIAHTKGKQTTSPKERDETVQMKIRKPSYSVQAPVEQNTISGYSAQMTGANTVVACNKKTQLKTIPGTSRLVKHKTLLTLNTVAQIQNKSSLKKVVSDGEREGLSLFWLVILIILILWAVGFLAGGFGLGGLINLLLLVALILLILWLLRII